MIETERLLAYIGDLYVQTREQDVVIAEKDKQIEALHEEINRLQVGETNAP